MRYYFSLLIASLAILACNKVHTGTNPVPPLVRHDTAVYIVGSDRPAGDTDIFSFSGLRACYWKNGVITLLDTQFSIAQAVAAKDTNIYIAGYENSRATGIDVAVYWKNGKLNPLSDASSNAQATAIALSGDDIYIAGVMNQKAVFWKNGELMPLNVPNSAQSLTTGIAVNGNDVYVSGRFPDTSGVVTGKMEFLLNCLTMRMLHRLQ